MPRPSEFDAHTDFLLTCDIPDDERDCWEWTGNFGKPYDRPIFPMRSTYPWKHNASKAAYRLFIGEVPDGCHVEHLCEQAWCVNPWHLDVCPPKRNYDRLKRTHCKYGHELDEANRVKAGEYAPGKPRWKCKTCAQRRDKERDRT